MGSCMHMSKGTISLPIFNSLDYYWPGIQVLVARSIMGSSAREKT